MRISDWSSEVCSSDLCRRSNERFTLSLSKGEAPPLLRRFLPIGDEVRPLLRVGDAGIGHLRARHGLARMGVEGVERRLEIGRQSCRERVCHSVYITVVPEALKQKT